MGYFEAVGAMRRLNLLRQIRSRALLAHSGLHPGQPKMLAFIREHPGCTQKEAADDLDITPASAAASLKRLEKAGFVRRTADPRDCRRNQLFVTEAGAEQLAATHREFERLDEAMFSGMGEEEVQAFQRACEKMFDNLADESCRHLTVWKLARQSQREETDEEDADQ